MRLNDRVDVLFFPVLRTSKANFLTPEEQEKINAGKVIMRKMKYSGKKSTCFVQLDPATQHIIYVPTHVVGKNLELLADLAHLKPEEIHAIKEGDTVTFEANGATFTAGIALLSEFGVHLHAGDEKAWKDSLSNGLRKYNFAIHGCWVKDPYGAMSYVKEENYTDDMKDAMHQQAENNAQSIRFMQR